jgi:SAM-dependent methyltransferase
VTVLDAPPSVGLASFRQLVAVCGVANPDRVAAQAERTVRYLSATAAKKAQLPAPHSLESRWYESLAAGEPDYSVYDHDDYLAELWGCWIIYSRRYLRNHVRKGPPLEGTIADLGCGFGFTSAALTEIADGEVVATNLPGTIQWRLADTVSARYPFTLLPELDAPVDAVFASEYFEHFPAPVAHLRELVEVGRPTMLIHASTFGQPSTGHFTEYDIDGDTVSGQAAARRFRAELGELGYTRLDVPAWNNRPEYWTR